ncbi:MAG: PilN domain-containing protein [Alphaproteobacteria bacterium]|nr:PilN domain-containing protein [Alphaproteobacteria bacterium]
MNAKDLLNMDMETATQWLLHFWRWWTGELMGMLPHEWRERLTRRLSVTAELKGSQVVYRNEDTGAQLMTKPRGPIKLLMPPESVLVREIELPLLPMSDVKRMVALDIDRLSPFQADQVYFDADIVSRDQENGRQQVAVGILPRAAAELAVADAAAHDLSPAAIGVKPRGAETPNFDFLAAMREAQGGDAAQRRSLYWWGAAAALFAVNLFVLTWRDSSDLDQLRQTVETQQSSANIAMRTRARVDKETAQRTALLDAKRRNAPLPVLDAVTAAMPMDAWVRRFEWNGRTVHITGQRKTSQDILARLEASPALRNAKSLAGDGQPDTAGNIRFEFTADRDLETSSGGGPRK